MLLNQTIRLFLDSIGRREEYEFYLNKFQAADAACFALLVPDFACLEQGAEAFAFDLNFLLRLGLRPAVVLSGHDADARWKLLAENPLFVKAVLPEVGGTEGQVPVFFEPLERMVPCVGKRVHFIRAAGGFDADYYYTQRENSLQLTDEEQRVADEVAALLDARPGTHLSVTSPMNLLQEIFTVKGAGTVFRRGSTIEKTDLAGLDSAKLMLLLEDSFKKSPIPHAVDDVSTVYLETGYRGAVLLEEQEAGLYLSKFAVGPQARGEGLAQELWDEVCLNHSAFFWRSRTGNPVNQWYDRQADGYFTAGQWIVFWRGISADAIPRIVDFCQNRAPDFL